MKTEIKNELHNDLIEVGKGIKPGAIFLSEEWKEIEEIRLEVAKHKDIIYGTCKCKDNREDTEHYLIFFKDKRLALRWDSVVNHFKFTDLQKRAFIGQLIGIPQCCILNFVRHKGNFKKMYKSYKSKIPKGGRDMYKLEYSGKLKDDPEMEGVGHTDYIFFIPCSPKCEGTRKIYTQNKTFWEKESERRLG